MPDPLVLARAVGVLAEIAARAAERAAGEGRLPEAVDLLKQARGLEESVRCLRRMAQARNN